MGSGQGGEAAPAARCNLTPLGSLLPSGFWQRLCGGEFHLHESPPCSPPRMLEHLSGFGAPLFQGAAESLYFPPFFPEVLGWSEGILLGALCCCLVSLELSHPVLGGLREHEDLWNPVWRLEAPVGAFSLCPQLQLAPEVVRARG